MKKTLRSKVLIMGIITSVLLLGFGLGIAVGDQPLNLVINGVKINSSPSPVIINGRTFVPVRLVAETLGVPVKWDANTSTVTIGEDPQTGVDMVTELKPQSYEKILKPIKVDKYEFSKGFKIDCPLVWNLGGEYKTLHFYAVGENNYIFVKVDGKDIFQKKLSDEIKEFTVDVENVDELKIYIYDKAFAHQVYIFNPRCE